MSEHAVTRGELAGRTIALPETRELDLLARMIEGEGATTVRCPLVAILDAPDPAPVLAWIDELAARRMEDVILFTGEGVRRLVHAAETSGRRDAFVEALRNVRKITRGPKPVRALRELGLEPDLLAGKPTTDGLIATLSQESLQGRTIGVQLYGEEPNEKLMTFLQGAGATPRPVAPYRYASKADDERVGALIEQLAHGAIDLIAFTSSAQVDRLQDVARSRQLGEQLRAGLDRTRVAAIGPVAAESLHQQGIRVDVVPERTFTLKPLVKAIVTALSGPMHQR
jgi:uroporphyrinogen-III synthase